MKGVINQPYDMLAIRKSVYPELARMATTYHLSFLSSSTCSFWCHTTRKVEEAILGCFLGMRDEESPQCTAVQTQ